MMIGFGIPQAFIESYLDDSRGFVASQQTAGIHRKLFIVINFIIIKLINNIIYANVIIYTIYT